VPDGETLTESEAREIEVVPALHEYVAAPLAINVSVAGEQFDGELTVIVGSGFTVTVAVAVFTQPFASVPVTV
jgi:hypothetical protein